METTQSNNHPSENIGNQNLQSTSEELPDDIAEEAEATQEHSAEEASTPGGEEDEGDIADGTDEDAKPENQEADEGNSGVTTKTDNSQWPFGRKPTDSEVSTGAAQ